MKEDSIISNERIFCASAILSFRKLLDVICCHVLNVYTVRNFSEWVFALSSCATVVFPFYFSMLLFWCSTEKILLSISLNIAEVVQ